jgi:tRNA pseudouridine38-40 synthase
MTHWKVTLAYDGTPYHGWQVQPGLTTVQGTVSDAIFRALRQRVLPQGSGRTDTGVHALRQVASFSVDAPIPAGRLQLALNRCLPSSIRVLSAEQVPPTFHARHSAIRKTYEYRIFPLRPSGGTAGKDEFVPEAICPPTLAPFVWPCPWPLDLEALSRASAHVLGEHDFTTFSASDPDLAMRDERLRLVPTGSTIAVTAEKAAQARTPIRTITQSEWHESEGLLIYRVTATGFLHHMVRNLVGTFVQAGAHRLDPDSSPELLAARNRAVSGPTAPACGLFLVSVEYPELAETVENGDLTPGE